MIERGGWGTLPGVMKRFSSWVSVGAGAVLALAGVTGNAAFNEPVGAALAGVMLRHFDGNADQILDGGEWQSGIGDSFRELDAGGDGVISAEELDGLRETLGSEVGELAAGVLVLVIRQVVMTLDENGDKLVSREEFAALSGRLFETLDVDADGSLSAAEAAALPERLLKKAVGG